jgi:hypothetical protein
MTPPTFGATPGVPVATTPGADEAPDAARDSDATMDSVWAAAKPMRAETMTDLEKYIFTVV